MNGDQNAKVLREFTAYCQAHPDERFWQALRNWSDHNFVIVSNSPPLSGQSDTFAWQGKTSHD